MPAPAYLLRTDGTRLAYDHQPGHPACVMFCPGFMSDMQGLKAQALAHWCAARGQACLRFDYSGHGQSGGSMADGSIERWRDDTLAVLDDIACAPVVLVGSSMGGWMALLAALARPTRVAALVLLAPAPDFTQWGLAAGFTPAQHDALARDGAVAVPSAYGAEPYVYARALIESGARCSLLGGVIDIGVPVRILHGMADPDVPWQISLTLADRLASPDVHVQLIKDGDHRLSRPGDIARMCEAVEQVLPCAQ